jgi:hypothetical protein
VGDLNVSSIRAAKVWGSDNAGTDTWMESAMNWMALPGECDNTPAPLVVNISGGAKGQNQRGTDLRSRRLDYHVWINRQLYVVAAGNEGPGPGRVRSPGVAKNALTVGNVFDYGYLSDSVGDIAGSSSRGPTGDGRMKPNLVAPGNLVTSAEAGTTSGYITKSGSSMAAPHVTGLAATLMEHYPSFRFNPALMRAHMMATAMARHGVNGPSNDYGFGRASGYVAHWAHTNNDGWNTYRYWGTVSSNGFAYGDIEVPPGTQRLVVALTWDEPPASAGASRAVLYDVDLWLDLDVNCAAPTGACGEYSSRSTIDNVEYVVVDSPPAGIYRMKVVPANVHGIVLDWGMAATIIRGDPTPAVNAYLTAPSNPVVGSTFGVTVNVSTPAYVASAVQVEPYLSYVPPGTTPLGAQTTRLDGVTMSFTPMASMTLGNIVPILSRSATWYFRADTPGPKDFYVRVRWENQGELILNTTFAVVPDMSVMSDLVQTAMAANPPAPLRAPGTTFSVTDTVQNIGAVPSGPSTTRS